MTLGRVRFALVWALIFGLLYLISRYSYLLFHNIAEVFSIAVALAVFLLVWSSRKYFEDSFLKVIGTSLLFVGILDIIHTLAYKGMNIFQGYDANLPTQLWISARYLQAFSFLVATFFIGKRRFSFSIATLLYSFITVTLIALIFTGLFPDCYIEGRGLTTFKKLSEYVISAIIVATMLMLKKNKSFLDEKIYLLLVSAMAVTIGSELFFTAYISVFGLSNLLGHYLKIIAFYLIYKAIVEIGLMKPYDLLFRDLSIANSELMTHREKLEELIAERTAELSYVNEELVKEINQRIKNEKALYELNETLEAEIAARIKAEEALKETLEGLERKIAERTAELSASEEKFRSIVQTASDAVIVADASGSVVFWNTGAERIFGYSAEEVVGMPLSLIMPERFKDAHEKGLKRFVSEGISGIIGRPIETVGLRKNGMEVPIELSLASWMTKDGPYMAGILRDITERKEAAKRQEMLIQELEAANKELNDFAYIVSHDLKAPLRSINTLAGWVLTDYGQSLNEECRKHIEMLISKARHMHNLIDAILRYSRASRSIEKKTFVDTKEIVFRVIKLLSPPPNISINIDGLPFVFCDGTRMEQVFMNLITNAVSFMDKPNGLIKIGCEVENGFYKFYVSDNGPGIEERHFDRIFQMFQTLRPTEDSNSTGVGLSIVKKIVELHGGRVWVESKVGEGATFYFTLPIDAEEVLNEMH